MTGKLITFRLPATHYVDKQIADSRETVARSLALLESHPAPDVFLGPKTQEPFIQEPQSDKPV